MSRPILARALAIAFALASALGGCRDESSSPSAPSPAPSAAKREAAPTASAGVLGACGRESTVEQLAPGLALLTLVPTTPPAIPSPDACLRVVRADPSLYALELGAAGSAGTSHPAPRWAELRGAAAVINASMFHEGGQSTGLLLDGEDALTGTVNQKFGAFLAAKPRREGRAPIALVGQGCDGFNLATLRRDYEMIVQNYRLLACDGSAIDWKDEKIYSAAAVGIDKGGNILFIHARAPYKMRAFAALLADEAMGLKLTAAMYVEGGPEATVYVEAGARRGVFVGSYESNFLENHDNRAAWPLPNVLLLVPRA